MTNFITNSLISERNFHDVIDEFENMFRNTQKIRKLLFGRKDFKSKSLFEQILSISSMGNKMWQDLFVEIIRHIWNEFKLWEKPEILTLVSHHPY